jgi:hypothetical protein
MKKWKIQITKTKSEEESTTYLTEIKRITREFCGKQ